MEIHHFTLDVITFAFFYVRALDELRDQIKSDHKKFVNVQHQYNKRYVPALILSLVAAIILQQSKLHSWLEVEILLVAALFGALSWKSPKDPLDGKAQSIDLSIVRDCDFLIDNVRQRDSDAKYKEWSKTQCGGQGR